MSENKKIILAVVGLPGAGKTQAIEYLVEKTGWPKVYFGDVTFDEMKKTNLEENEANERRTRERLRNEYGIGCYAVLSIPKIKKFAEESNVLVESLYGWEEYLEMIKEFGNDFKVLAILASPEIRIKRMANRPVRPLSREELVSRDYSQIENLHQAGPIARADYFIVNEGTKEKLHQEIDKVLKSLEVE